MNSNHPPSIIKNLSESISRRKNKLSSDRTVFNNSKELFNDALSNSGFDHKIKVFNRNNIKVTYSSMPNFASIINSHNKKILNENIAKPTSASCNCRERVKGSCPLDGNCLQSSFVYMCKAATLKITNDYPHYIGLAENTFKGRLYKHKNSFRYESKKNATELSNFVCENKHANTETSLE